MKKDMKKSLEEQILTCKKMLKDLAPFIEFDGEKSKEYNKIIVKKAILVDRYKRLCYRASFSVKVKNLISKSLGKKKKLICDYF